jgi:flagellar motor switch protein FliN
MTNSFDAKNMQSAHDFMSTSASSDENNIDAILRIPVTIQVVLGSAQMSVSHLMRLSRGSVIALDQRIGEAVNIVVNGRVVARGEVVVLEEDSSRFGVSLTEIVALSKNEKNKSV